MILQIYDGDVDRTRAYYQAQGMLDTPAALERFEHRAACCWRWIETYAPDSFRYRIRTEPVARELSGDIRTAIERLVQGLRDNPDVDEAGMLPLTRAMTEGLELERAALFPVVYDLLIDREKGPKLTTLIGNMGAAKALPLLEASLA